MKLGLRIGDIKNSTGSSYIELNNTKVIATVHGPMEPTKIQQENALSGIIECFVENSWDIDNQFITIQHRLQHTFSSTICHKTYFKTLIRISITVLEKGDSLLDAATLAGSLALVDAGIQMKDFVVSCTVGLIDNEFKPFVSSNSSIRVSFLPSKNEIVETEVNGKINASELSNNTEIAINGCLELIESVRNFLTQYNKKN